MEYLAIVIIALVLLTLLSAIAYDLGRSKGWSKGWRQGYEDGKKMADFKKYYTKQNTNILH